MCFGLCVRLSEVLAITYLPFSLVFVCEIRLCCRVRAVALFYSFPWVHISHAFFLSGLWRTQSDYDSAHSAAQSASSFEMCLLWRLVAADQQNHRMSHAEFLNFYESMGTHRIPVPFLLLIFCSLSCKTKQNKTTTKQQQQKSD